MWGVRINATRMPPDIKTRRAARALHGHTEGRLNIIARHKGRLSVLALVLANLIPIGGVLFLGWSAANIVLLYWAENLIVGFYAILRIAAMPVESPLEHLGKVFMIPFFILHFGGFCAAHGLFLMFLLGAGGEAEPVFPHINWPGPLVFMQLLVSIVVHLWRTRPPEMTLPLIVLFASHGISFVENYLCRGEYRAAGSKDQMARPYKRVVITHIAILAGAVPVMALGAPAALLIVLMTVKLAFDLFHHLKSHRAARSASGIGTKRGGVGKEPGRFGIGEIIRILNSRGESLREPRVRDADREKVKQA